MSLTDEQRGRETSLHAECVMVLKALHNLPSETRQSANMQMVAKTETAIAECEGASTESKVVLGLRLTQHGSESLERDIAHGASTWVVGASLQVPNMPKSNTQNLLEWEVRYLLKQAGASHHIIENFPVFDPVVAAKALEAKQRFKASQAEAKAQQAERDLARRLTTIETDYADFFDFVDICMALTLGFSHGRLFGTLALAKKEILALSEEKRFHVHCAAFGMMDALAKHKGISLDVTYEIALAFFQWRLFDTERQARYILFSKMYGLKPNTESGDFLVQGGQAIFDFMRTEDVNSFELLGNMLA